MYFQEFSKFKGQSLKKIKDLDVLEEFEENQCSQSRVDIPVEVIPMKAK